MPRRSSRLQAKRQTTEIIELDDDDDDDIQMTESRSPTEESYHDIQSSDYDDDDDEDDEYINIPNRRSRRRYSGKSKKKLGLSQRFTQINEENKRRINKENNMRNNNQISVEKKIISGIIQLVLSKKSSKESFVTPQELSNHVFKHFSGRRRGSGRLTNKDYVDRAANKLKNIFGIELKEFNKKYYFRYEEDPLNLSLREPSNSNNRRYNKKEIETKYTNYKKQRNLLNNLFNSGLDKNEIAFRGVTSVVLQILTVSGGSLSKYKLKKILSKYKLSQFGGFTKLMLDLKKYQWIKEVKTHDKHLTQLKSSLDDESNEKDLEEKNTFYKCGPRALFEFPMTKIYESAFVMCQGEEDYKKVVLTGDELGINAIKKAQKAFLKEYEPNNPN